MSLPSPYPPSTFKSAPFVNVNDPSDSPLMDAFETNGSDFRYLKMKKFEILK